MCPPTARHNPMKEPRPRLKKGHPDPRLAPRRARIRELWMNNDVFTRAMIESVMTEFQCIRETIISDIELFATEDGTMMDKRALKKQIGERPS